MECLAYDLGGLMIVLVKMMMIIINI